MMATSICHRCHAIFSSTQIPSAKKDSPLEEGVEYRMTRQELRTSAIAGCPFCRSIAVGLKHKDLQRSEQDFKISDLDFGQESSSSNRKAKPLILRISGISRRDIPGDIETLVVSNAAHGSNRGHIVRLDVQAEEDNPASPLISTRPVNPEVGSDAAFHTAKSWIKTCIGCHRVCIDQARARLPTRVIDVNNSETTRQIKVYRTQHEKEPYTALSYCWGGQQPLILKLENVATITSWFPLSKVSKTIQDAAIATRKLGIRWLWVDCLCIMQNSSADVARELAEMADIYRYAKVTIMVGSARSSQDGFLQRRPAFRPEIPWFSLPFCMSGKNENAGGGRGGSILVRSEQRYMFQDEPLNQRAWALQERCLAPRLLIFDSFRLRWRCASMSVSNGGHDRLALGFGPEPMELSGSTNRDTRRTTPSSGGLSATSTMTTSSATPLQWWRWRRLLEDFTRRSVSLPSDKLPALSAIAAEYARLTADTYKAGLWANSLVVDLHWRSFSTTVRSAASAVAKHRTSNRRSLPTYRAPSWSWAAIDGAIVYDRIDSASTRFDVLACTTQLANPALPYGQVTGARLEVAGMLRKGTIVLLGDDDIPVINDPHTGERLGVFYPDTRDDYDIADLPTASVWCLRTTSAWEAGSTREYALVLRRIDHGPFARLGLLKFVEDEQWLYAAERKTITIL